MSFNEDPPSDWTDDEAARFLGVGVDGLDVAAGQGASVAIIDTPQGRRWDVERLRKWRRVFAELVTAAISTNFAAKPKRVGSGGPPPIPGMK